LIESGLSAFKDDEGEEYEEHKLARTSGIERG
jgi:hypothetical protein